MVPPKAQVSELNKARTRSKDKKRASADEPCNLWRMLIIWFFYWIKKTSRIKNCAENKKKCLLHIVQGLPKYQLNITEDLPVNQEFQIEPSKLQFPTHLSTPYSPNQVHYYLLLHITNARIGLHVAARKLNRALFTFPTKQFLFRFVTFCEESEINISWPKSWIFCEIYTEVLLALLDKKTAFTKLY